LKLKTQYTFQFADAGVTSFKAALQSTIFKRSADFTVFYLLMLVIGMCELEF